MKVLLIDVGNTRIKWQLVVARRGGTLRSAAWNGRNLDAVATRLCAGAAGATAVYVCSVAERRSGPALRRAARRAGLPRPVFVRSARKAAGVTNAYREAWRLGVDRWMALIGARALYPDRAICIIDIGTAMTVDLMDRKGRHRGGAIIPGPRMMVESLLSRTAQIRERAGLGRRVASRRNVAGLFARDTQRGLKAGATHACAAFIEHAWLEASALLRERPVLLLTGGAAELVGRRFRGRANFVDDLVLQGLAVLANTASR